MVPLRGSCVPCRARREWVGNVRSSGLCDFGPVISFLRVK